VGNGGAKGNGGGRQGGAAEMGDLIELTDAFEIGDHDDGDEDEIVSMHPQQLTSNVSGGSSASAWDVRTTGERGEVRGRRNVRDGGGLGGNTLI